MYSNTCCNRHRKCNWNKLVTKNVRISKLQGIEKEIMLAAKIYLETNNTAQEQLYKQGNAVIVPLNVLVNEGLLDLSTTDLKLDDIKDEYVLTGRTGGGSNLDGCTEITSTSSWNLSDENPLYICTKSDGSITLSGDAGLSDNLGAVKREPYYKNGYIYYKNVNTLYQLLYIDTDDGIVIVHNSNFNNELIDKSEAIVPVDYVSDITCSCSDGRMPRIVKIQRKEERELKFESGEHMLSSLDVARVFSCKVTNDCTGRGHIYYAETLLDTWGNSGYSIKDFRKIKLKPCMKITSGNGTKINPYKIEDQC